MTLPLWMRVLGAGIILSVIFGVGWAIHHHIYMSGYNVHKAETKLRDEQAKNKALADKIAADAEVRKREEELAAEFDRRIALNHKDQANEKADADRLIADLRSRNKRLSIPVTKPVCQAGADAGTGSSAGAGAEGRAELTPGAGETLVRIAERGDDAIRKHATVVGLYNDLRQACMQSP